MPLIHSSSHKAFIENIQAEINAGKSQEQATAIAYSIQAQARKDEQAENKE